jgi:hypothetical protein
MGRRGVPVTLEEYEAEIRKVIPVVRKPGLRWAFEEPGLVPRRGMWCEFGVHGGSTLRQIAGARGDAELWGFDSFRGLPEDWNIEHKKGLFKLEHPIMPPEGVNLMVGWFADTLKHFEPDVPVTFVHLDCDLYSAAKTVFDWLFWGENLDNNGTVIVLDDFFTKPLDNGLLRAFSESCVAGGSSLKVEWLANPHPSDVAVARVSYQ